MASSCSPSLLTFSCWAVGAVVVSILVWLAVTNLTTAFDSSSPHSSSSCSAMRGSLSAKRAAASTHTKAAPLDHSFNEVTKMDKVTASMPWDKSVAKQEEAETMHGFMAMFIDEDKMQSSLKPMTKEGAMRGANTSAYSMTESSRAENGKVSNLGVNVLAGIRPKPASKPIGNCSISFNDADTRQMTIISNTGCDKTNTCSWQVDCQ